MAAIERGINEHEIGALVKFGLQHPAARGIVFQPVTHTGRHLPFNPMERITIPDVLHGIIQQTDGLFRQGDFVPVPCCFPTCQVNTYVYVNGDQVIPLPRVLAVDQYLDYITNRTLPMAPSLPDIQRALEGLWSASAVATASQFSCACEVAFDLGTDLSHVKKHVFQIAIKDFMDPYTFSVKQVMKCCVGVLVPDGRLIPFCAYNSVGYREKIRAQLASRPQEQNLRLHRTAPGPGQSQRDDRSMVPIQLRSAEIPIHADRRLAFQGMPAFGANSQPSHGRSKVLERQGDQLLVEFHTSVRVFLGFRKIYRTVERVTLHPPEAVEF